MLAELCAARRNEGRLSTRRARLQKALLLGGLVLSSLATSALAKPLNCFDKALEAAPKLVQFHFGELDGFQLEVDKGSLKNLKPLRNPADPSENLTVVEVWATIYKGNYRTRFLFSTKSASCLLVGQELLEVARF